MGVSEPLLKLIRKLMAGRGWNTASLADASGIDRSRLRKVLAGAESMTVDELLLVGQALEISPEDLGLPAPSEEEGLPPEASAAPLHAVSEEGEPLGLDPFGNQPEQLFRVGFELGCDFLFVARAEDLADSGVPPHILERFEDRDFPIRLDAVYHKYNQPRFEPEGVTLTLSFDALYDCRFPWHAIKQVVFFPVAPDPPEEEEQGEEDETPVLRLVT